VICDGQGLQHCEAAGEACGDQEVVECRRESGAGLMSEEKPKKTYAVCECGKTLVGEDASFWGECDKCRLKLPIQTSQGGDTKTSGGQTDREYHGGLTRGEW